MGLSWFGSFVLSGSRDSRLLHAGFDISQDIEQVRLGPDRRHGGAKKGNSTPWGLEP